MGSTGSPAAAFDEGTWMYIVAALVLLGAAARDIAAIVHELMNFENHETMIAKRRREAVA